MTANPSQVGDCKGAAGFLPKQLSRALVAATIRFVGEIQRYRNVFAALDFEGTWTPFEQVRNIGRTQTLALLDAMLEDRPHARQVPITDLL